MPNSALPDNLKGKNHSDWPWPFSYIPRGWTAFKWKQPPVLMWGKIYESEFGGPRPAQVMGWHVDGLKLGMYSLPIWFSVSFPKYKKYFGIGARWDGNDGYYQFPSVNLGTIDNFDARYKAVLEGENK